MKEFSKEDVDEMCLIGNKLSEIIHKTDAKLISLNEICAGISEKDIQNLLTRYDGLDLIGVVELILTQFYYHKTITVTSKKSILSYELIRDKFILSKDVTSVSVDNLQSFFTG
jgi:hypothetical protein